MLGLHLLLRMTVNPELDRRGADRLDADTTEARRYEIPPAELCVKLARAHAGQGNAEEAYRWLTRAVDGGDSFAAWTAGAVLLDELRGTTPPPARRSVKVALTGSYTTSQYGALLKLAALRRGIDVTLQEGSFDQYRQDLLAPSSALYAFEPDYVMVALHAGAAELPQMSTEPAEAVEQELRRLRSLWHHIREHSNAQILHHTFAIPPDEPLGHLAARIAGSRHRILQEVNVRLQGEAPDRVSFIDLDRLAAYFGKARWFDDRNWHRAKQAVSPAALPLLARHTAAVLAAHLGLSRKCLVLDLDNTLWGGVVGEDGLSGLKLGSGDPRGEAFIAFQEYILRLKERGVVLAVASKNNEADAREPFERHPDMRIRLDDIAVFIANWDDKPTNLRRVASMLEIGTDALVLVDDNPAEREVVRELMPDVEVVPLGSDPARYARALADSLLFEPAMLTKEDRERTAQYRGRAEALELQAQAETIEDFYRDLEMRALVAPFDELQLPRIVQLIAKTNQFNLTTRRHDVATIRRFMSDPSYVHLCLRLGDRFTDHGVVGVLIAHQSGDVLEIDTWLMSCRVIGRTAENEMLAHLCRRANELGCSRLRGVYVPTAKNGVVRDLYANLDFTNVAAEDGSTIWEYDISEGGPIRSEYINEWESVREPV
jgi:FkbH-like protein